MTVRQARESPALVAPVAHDVANLLMAVFATAEAIATRASGDAETLDDARTIQAGVRRAAALLRRLMRPEAARAEAVALNPAVADLASLLRRVLAEGIRLDLDLAEPGPVVLADPAELDRVVLNLALNARAAMANGGVLTLRTRVATGAAVLEVADTGSGMPPEVLARAFEAGFTTSEAEGHGLGLDSVRACMAACGGSVVLESRVGEGTTARLILPLTVAREPRRLAEPAAGEGLVLLVEDEAYLRGQMQAALQRAGWRVVAVESGEAALALAGEAPVAVVADYGLPGIDGAALVPALRERWDRPDLPAVLVSGYVLSAPGERVAVVAKPCGHDEVLAALGAVARG